MNLLMESLIGEYKDLRVKIDKVADLILMYGGQIPDIPPANTENVISVKRTSKFKGQEYPSQGTWKEKILFVLTVKGEPVTAKDIALAIEALEGYLTAREANLNTSHILKTVTQYTSAMSKSGEIGVDDSEFRNKYYLI